MSIGDLQKSVLALKFCQTRLVENCTDFDTKIGEVIAFLNAIESLLN